MTPETNDVANAAAANPGPASPPAGSPSHAAENPTAENPTAGNPAAANFSHAARNPVDAGSPAALTAGLPYPLVLPAYGGPCLSSLVPALLEPPGCRPGWLPAPLQTAGQVVLLVLDGLGWLQFSERSHLAPVMAGMEGGPITSVAPTTTATALTSISLGLSPAEHGVAGYKLVVDGPTGREVLNVLRWTTVSGDARHFVPPHDVQGLPAFGGRPVPVISRSEFIGSGFTQMHLSGAVQVGWGVPSSIPVLARRQLEEGHPFVYAYYEGVDKIAHIAGFGELYDAELAYADNLVASLVADLPRGCALAVTADHGQVEVGPRAQALSPEVLAATAMTSGESRFRWLHAGPGGVEDLARVTTERYQSEAWVATFDEVEGLGVLGGPLSAEARARLGDVALLPLGPSAYLDPRDGGDAVLVCRHGGLSPEEVLVPLLAAAR